MNAIFGVFASSPSSSVKRTVSTLQSTYTKRYAFDRSRTEIGETWGMGAMEQWITGEAEQSPQPYRLDSIVVVADAMLDYRDQLINQLELSHEDEYADVELIAHAYRKWGIDCVQQFQGIYAFAIYDEMSDELFIVRDRLGERAICYTVQEGELAFSTTPKPLATHYHCEIDEAYVEQYVVFPLRLTSHDAFRTPWQGIRYIPPGHTLRYKNGRIRLDQYWTYPKHSKREFASEEACYQELDQILKDATATCMRTDGEVGIMLSGGLDSTTVAAFAEPTLRQQHRSLHAFTHVPLAEYEDSEEVLGNERPLVEELLSNYPGIQPNWVENRERNSFNTIDDWLHILEIPYIFFINAPWMLSIHEQAQATGVKVMLNGKHGNFTISYGPLSTYYAEIIKTMQISKIMTEFRELVRMNQNPLQSLKQMIGPVLFKHREYRNVKNFFQQHTSQVHSEKVQQKLSYSHLDVYTPDVKKRNERMYEADDLHLRGVLSTMISLHFGCVIRDPLSDINLISFCASLPSEYFASKGVSKRLVRSLMKERLPHSILKSTRSRGKQSADWSVRLAHEKEKALSELKTTSLSQPYFQIFDISIHPWESLMNDVWKTSLLFRMIAIQKFKGGDSL
ncbi:asparagine synthetase B family protein [Exiguobacterium algae]|uniref:asparagine synthetase B family protein n=1 Tax=Exiguobacterium algae TaxID=2751250 RepID=UPI001BEA090A|nr:asparagine synthase-related protein [Exiguobacterium algae]